jgi:hypothetical protein
MSRWLVYIILSCGLLAAASCGNEVEQEDLVNSAVEIKLGQYRTNQLNECKDNAYRDAEDYVDSLLVAISLEKKLDTIPKPEKPSRPPRPVFKNKPDSIVVDRIYDEEQ